LLTGVEYPLALTGASQAVAASTRSCNFGPTSKTLLYRVTADTKRLSAANGGAAFPIDLVTASCSGLDPHISSDAAILQVDCVAPARGAVPDTVGQLVAEHLEGRTIGTLGEPRANVLLLNLSLDERIPVPD
jgi:K+-transporting ATPase ATPase C chain